MKRLLLFFILISCIFFAGNLQGQNNRKGSYNPKPDRKSQFLKTQWWLGFYGGLNLSRAMPGEKFSGIEPLDYDPSENDKLYESFELPSGVAGVDLTFYHHGFSFGFKPNYRIQQFSYSTSYDWVAENNPDYTLHLDYTHTHRLQFLDLPVTIKYDLMKGDFRPFIQAGGYYSILLDASKTLGTDGIDNASGSSGPFNKREVTVGVQDLFNSSIYGVMAGLGCSYDIWNVRFILDFDYRIGLKDINNSSSRYSENPFTGIGDAMDNLKLNSIGVNVSCVFPLRFISKDLKAVE